MKRDTTIRPLLVGGNRQADPWHDESEEYADHDQPVEPDDGEEGAAVFHSSSGSIFGDTSLIEDALLREAIGGRFGL